MSRVLGIIIVFQWLGLEDNEPLSNYCPYVTIIATQDGKMGISVVMREAGAMDVSLKATTASSAVTWSAD